WATALAAISASPTVIVFGVKREPALMPVSDWLKVWAISLRYGAGWMMAMSPRLPMFKPTVAMVTVPAPPPPAPRVSKVLGADSNKPPSKIVPDVATEMEVLAGVIAILAIRGSNDR